MQILLQNNTQPRNKILKNPTTMYTINGTMRSSLNERQPVIDFKILNMNTVNYARINGKSYYILNVEIISNDIMRVTFDMDLLTTYSEYILDCSAYVLRDSTDSQDNLVDSEIAKLATAENTITSARVDGFDQSIGTYILTTSGDFGG